MTEKLEWIETPYGFTQAEYKNGVITYDSHGKYNPKGLSLTINGDVSCVDTVQEAIEIIDKQTN